MSESTNSCNQELEICQSPGQSKMLEVHGCLSNSWHSEEELTLWFPSLRPSCPINGQASLGVMLGDGIMAV
jgi:hypothetical protein